MSKRFAWIYDEARGVKTWVADMWSRKRILTLQNNVDSLQTTKQDALSATQINAINAVTAPTAYTLTRIENSFVNATDFARLSAYKVSNTLAILICNLKLSAQFTGTTFTAIGTISDISPIRSHIHEISGQNAASHVMALQISTTGEISIYSLGSAAGEWYRAVIPIALA